jgi:yecA family protein
MSTSDQYGFLRDGIWSLGGRGANRRLRESASADLLTPDVVQMGHEPFTDQHMDELAQQLLDVRWPRGTLNICGLEGLLTALLVLPLGLRPATWLPLIWNESGWRVPPALQGVDAFYQFIEVIVGFMRRIDKGLLEVPPHLALTLSAPTAQAGPRLPNARQDWARGFCLAVSQSDNFKVRPDSIVYDALFAIAIHSNPSSASPRHGRRAPLPLEHAVLTLAATRATRGPLGGLET